MNLKWLLIVIYVFLFAAPFYADDAAKEMDNSKWAYRQGMLLSSVKHGGEAMNLVCQKLASGLVAFMPDLNGYTITGTNQYYSFSSENGTVDYTVQVQKIFSNQNAGIQLNYDISPNNVERYYNLFKSFDYLNDKGVYRKYSFKLRKTDVTYLMEGSNAYLLYILAEKDGELQSGFLIKIEYSYFQGPPVLDRRKLVDETVREFAEKMNVAGIRNLLK